MNVKQVKLELEQAQTLELISSAYVDIAALKLQKIRKRVLSNRSFFQDLTQIFSLLRFLAAKKSAKFKMPGNNRTLAILLTSNFRFNGKISESSANFFVSKTKDQDFDLMVIGKSGSSYLNQIKFPKKFQEVNFVKDMPDREEMNLLISKIKDYSRVLVFYFEFKTVLSQVPKIADITQTQAASLQEQQKNQSPTDNPFLQTTYILEPELEKMINFFDSQIKNILLQETLLEAELARVAARLILMNQAENTSSIQVKQQKRKLSSAKRILMNKKTLEIWGNISIANKI